MLRTAVEAYIGLMQGLGYCFKQQACMLRSFARFGRECGDVHVQTSTVLSWSGLGGSLKMRHTRLRTVTAFARHVHAEDPRHEIPPHDVYGYRYQRPSPFIFAPEQVSSLVAAASDLVPKDSLRPQTYRTLIGLLACAGLRSSEALALRLADLTADGLLVRETKFRKNRLLPLHESATEALHAYLTQRGRMAPITDHIFIDNHGKPLRYSALWGVFRKLIERLGLRNGSKRPTLHSLRHTFAVRALEQGPSSREHIGQYLLALSTYMGHARVSATYWYLEATAELMCDISSTCEASRREQAS